MNLSETFRNYKNILQETVGTNTKNVSISDIENKSDELFREPFDELVEIAKKYGQLFDDGSKCLYFGYKDETNGSINFDDKISLGKFWSLYYHSYDEDFIEIDEINYIIYHPEKKLMIFFRKNTLKLHVKVETLRFV